MKKTLIALSFACAGALAFADKEQFNSSWFSGINNATAIDALGAQNGVWNLTVDSNASVNKDGALELDLDADEEATFKVADTAKEEAKDAFPVQGLVVRGVCTPIAADDLLTGKAMATTKGAKVGFAIVNVGGEPDAYKYYAWVGGGSKAETESTSAIADWVDLGPATDVTEAKTIVIGLDYSEESVVTAEFAVGGGDLSDLKQAASLTQEKGVPLKDLALSKALADRVIASVSCMGSGTLNELKGLYQYAVAEVNGTLYGTVEDAVVAAQQTGATVKLVRKAEGSVTVAGDVTIDATGKGTPMVTKNDETKEFASGTAEGVVTVQTKAAILEQIAVGPASKKSNLMKDEAKFRDFLNKHCSAYRAAGTTAGAMTADIQTALNTEDSTSKRTLWQSYALGVEPDATLKLAQVAKDVAEDGITLKFPGTPSGDFTIKYKVATEDGQTSATSTEAGVVKVPLVTGRYKVTVSFE